MTNKIRQTEYDYVEHFVEEYKYRSSLDCTPATWKDVIDVAEKAYMRAYDNGRNFRGTLSQRKKKIRMVAASYLRKPKIRFLLGEWWLDTEINPVTKEVVITERCKKKNGWVQPSEFGLSKEEVEVDWII